jgi:formate hydrogenlyase subunit 3/multisubunit Na+/H+ antiporter MnhD subunit
MKMNRFVWAGVVFAMIAIAAWTVGFLTTFVMMMYTLNTPGSPSEKDIASQFQSSFTVNMVALAVAIPAGLLAAGLLAAGLVKSYMDRRRPDSSVASPARRPPLS